MFSLLWVILNFGLAIFFLFVCFKATKLIRDKIGLFASLIFVFGLLSFIRKSTDTKIDNEPNLNQFHTWKFDFADTTIFNGVFQSQIVLEKSLINSQELSIQCYREQNGKTNLKVKAWSFMNGFTSGIDWVPSTIVINKVDEKSPLEYYVYGELEWNLLGFPIFSQAKTYNGSVPIE